MLTRSRLPIQGMVFDSRLQKDVSIPDFFLFQIVDPLDVKQGHNLVHGCLNEKS